jgi:hypothetical protein
MYVDTSFDCVYALFECVHTLFECVHALFECPLVLSLVYSLVSQGGLPELLYKRHAQWAPYSPHLANTFCGACCDCTDEVPAHTEL